MFTYAKFELWSTILVGLSVHGYALALDSLLIASATPTCPNYGLQADNLPQITTPPSRGALELKIRQVSQTALATCGWIDGDGDNPVTCGTSLYCATTSTYIGCCSLTNCVDIFTACYDILGNTCDQNCRNNPQNLVCSSPAQYCAAYNYEGGSIGLGCAAYQGYTTTVFLSTKTNLGPVPSPSNSTTSASIVTVTEASETPTPPVPASSDHGGLSTGATAGIAVAATLIVVFLAIGGWIILRRKKKQEKKLATSLGPMSPKPYTDADPGSKELAYGQNAANRISTTPSELPYTPMSPEFRTGQPSPGLGPPRYSQAYEMPDSSNNSDRPKSYPVTELSSQRSQRT